MHILHLRCVGVPLTALDHLPIRVQSKSSVVQNKCLEKNCIHHPHSSTQKKTQVLNLLHTLGKTENKLVVTFVSLLNLGARLGEINISIKEMEKEKRKNWREEETKLHKKDRSSNSTQQLNRRQGHQMKNGSKKIEIG